MIRIVWIRIIGDKNKWVKNRWDKNNCCPLETGGGSLGRAPMRLAFEAGDGPRRR